MLALLSMTNLYSLLTLQVDFFALNHKKRV